MLKNLLRRLLITLVTGAVFILITNVTLLLTITPDNINAWVEKSGAYTAIPNTMVDNLPTNNTQVEGQSFADAGVKKALKDSITTEYMHQNVSSKIDEGFKWLNGDSKQPNFTIDLQPVKEKFATNLGSYAKSRYLALPDCPPNSLPNNTSPLQIECKPAIGFDINQQADEITKSVLGSKDFLASSSSIANSTEQANNVGAQETTNDAGAISNVPRVYGIFKNAPFFIMLVVLLSCAGIIYLSESKKVGLRKIGRIFLVVGIVSSISIWLEYKAASLLFDQFSKNFIAQNKLPATLADTLTSLFESFRMALFWTGIKNSIFVAVLGTLVLVSVFLYKKRGEKIILQNQSNTSPQPLAQSAQKIPAPKPLGNQQIGR